MHAVLARLVALTVAVAGAPASPGAATEPSRARPEVLPPLAVDGIAARAHTQGLELDGDTLLVTARREDVRPPRALLLRTRIGSAGWDAWDITVTLPGDGVAEPRLLDHPGGFQSDGGRLWIPVAESRRQGHSRIRVFPLSGLVPGATLHPTNEIAVADHIGAIAVSASLGIVAGASWDTESVYLWNLEGQLQRRLGVPDLKRLRLGHARGTQGREGLAVQDWKFSGTALVAAGLWKGTSGTAPFPASRVFRFEVFPGGGAPREEPLAPVTAGLEACREGMALRGSELWLLPGDLGQTNRVWRLPAPW